jgi:hypothetical protein
MAREAFDQERDRRAMLCNVLCANCCRTGPPEAPAEPLAGLVGPCGQLARYRDQEDCAVNRKSSDTP